MEPKHAALWSNDATYSTFLDPSFFRSGNLVAIVVLPRVSLLIVTSCALSFARRRFRSVLSSASFVFSPPPSYDVYRSQASYRRLFFRNN
jgi:hypothetical protein